MALLIHVAEKGSVATGFGMFATLALGMGIPYLILGTSSSLLTRLPKSGQWMVDVKIVLGVVLLILAAYYARGFLGDTVYGLVFGGLVLYIGLYINPFSRLDNMDRAVAGLVRLAAFLIVLFGTFEIGRALFGTALTQVTLGRGESVSPLVWEPYEENDLAQAVALSRPVAIDFQSKIWCAACREMEDKTFSRPEVKKVLGAYRLLEVDVDKHPRAKELQRQYQVRGIPTLIFLDGTGRELDRVVGFMGPEELLERMKGFSDAGEGMQGNQEIRKPAEPNAVRAHSLL